MMTTCRRTGGTRTTKMNNPKNCISHWHQVVSRVIRTPVTRIVRLQSQLEPPGHGSPISQSVAEGQLVSLLTPAIEDVGGLPCVLRSGHAAAKHSWKLTALIEDEGQLLPNALRIAEYCRNRTHPLPTDVWSVRQLVPTRPLCKAYCGLPVCPEWRILVRGEEVVSRICKWTREEIQAGSPVSNEWIEKFDDYFGRPEIEMLWADRAAQAAGLALLRNGDSERIWAIDVIQDHWTVWWVLDAKIHEEAQQ